jgi:hypothetical protein
MKKIARNARTERSGTHGNISTLMRKREEQRERNNGMKDRRMKRIRKKDKEEVYERR